MSQKSTPLFLYKLHIALFEFCSNICIMKIVGVILLLAVSFAGGYFVRSQSCVSQNLTNSAIAPTQTQVQVPTSTVMPTAIPIATSAATPTKQPETESVFNNYNSAGVGNNPTAPTVFTITSRKKIYTIQDYHWNSARGKTPGTIGLKSEDGKTYGPWTAQGAPGQGGVPDAYWTVYPDTQIPAGTYTIVDSDPSSWAQNSGTKGIGMSQVYAVK
jgi:hypothetical protein